MKGIIYILTNKYMPNIVKIGKTKREDIQIRMDELYSVGSGVPYPFELFYACEVDNINNIEIGIQKAFDDYRFNKKREFFTIDPYKIKNLIKNFGLELREIFLEVESKDEEVKDIIEEENKKDRLPKFNFEKAGIKPGSILFFADDQNIKAEVIDNTWIKCYFNGENIENNCSIVAQKLKNLKRQPQGTLYWLFNGETLNERWVRLLTQ